MPEYNWKDSLDFRFYDFYERSDVNLIYVDEENPSSIALKFEIRNQSGIELILDAYKQDSKEESKELDKSSQANQKTLGNAATNNFDSSDSSVLEKETIVSAENFHIELRFRPGTLSTASLVQLDLSEASKEDWVMSRPVFHNSKEVSLYLLKCGRTLRLVDTDTTTFTLRGFAANSAGGSRGTNVIINYDKFKPVGDTVPLSGTKVLSLTILGHRGQRKAPLAICFANQNTILNNGEKSDDIELQITNLGNEPIALSPKTEFTIEIDAQAEKKDEPWAVAKKDEAANFNITVKKREIQEANDRYWCWNVNSSAVDKNTEEPRFIFRDIYRQVGSLKAINSSVVNRSQELEFPRNLQAEVIQFNSDPNQVQVAYPGTVWKNGAGYSLEFQEDGNLVLYNSNKQPLWSTGTYQLECRADMLKFHPSSNLVLYHQGQPVWSTHTQKKADSKVCLELRQDGNFVIYDINDPSHWLFETRTNGGIQGEFDAIKHWTRETINTEDNSSSKPETTVVLESEYSFPNTDDLIFVLSNVKSSLPSGQGQIRFYYKNIPGYADGYQILNLYKTHLVERNKKIGIGKAPETELDVRGTVTATAFVGQGALVKGTVTATAFVGQGAVVRGMIMMWYGQSNEIPQGWAICDGSNSTPDLRDKFIIGAGLKGKGDTGGSSSVKLELAHMPAHKHNGTTSENGSHSHTYDTTRHQGQHSNAGSNRDEFYPNDKKETDPVGSHTHDFETNWQGGGEVFSILPPYYALFFIMRL